MNFCQVNGHRIHYKILRRKVAELHSPFLVFLHEGLGSIAQWKDFPEEISETLGLAALVYDRYGHGHSDMLQEKRDSRFMHDAAQKELPELLEKLGIHQPLVLIGHSDGATIALAHASYFPARVMTVVSEAAHVMVEDISRSGILNTMLLFKESKLREFLMRYHGKRVDSMFYGWAETWISEAMNDWNMKEELSKITAPVLAIQGVNDEYGSPEQLEWIMKYSSGYSESFLVPDCGHIPHFQQREKVSKKIITFIRQNI